jgi:hypothetical protein
MLISFWWVVVAFILGGTGGVMALALLSGKPDGEDRDSGPIQGISHTH